MLAITCHIAVSVAQPSFACSLVSCVSNGIEFKRTFTVSVKHEGKPFPGAHVEVAGPANLRLTTGSNGQATIRDLPPGNYWIKSDFLGIGAGYECFHVLASSTKHAKGSVKYTWGDDPMGISRVNGVLLDSQLGTGGTPIWNLTHRVLVTIPGVKVRLQNPLTGSNLELSSDQQGHFNFNSVARGIYVLHIERGSTGREFDPADLLLYVGTKAKRDTLTLVRTEPSGGSCGGPSLILQ